MVGSASGISVGTWVGVGVGLGVGLFETVARAAGVSVGNWVGVGSTVGMAVCSGWQASEAIANRVPTMISMVQKSFVIASSAVLVILLEWTIESGNFALGMAGYYCSRECEFSDMYMQSGLVESAGGRPNWFSASGHVIWWCGVGQWLGRSTTLCGEVSL